MAGNKHRSVTGQTSDISQFSSTAGHENLLRTLHEHVKSLPVVDLETVQKIQQLIRLRRLDFDDDKVAEKFLELEAIISG